MLFLRWLHTASISMNIYNLLILDVEKPISMYIDYFKTKTMRLKLIFQLKL